MKTFAFSLLSLMTLSTTLIADSKHVLHVSFPDGTGVEIVTHTTGSSQIDREGEAGIGKGAVSRTVTDQNKEMLFGYDLVVTRGADPNTVMIQIQPLNGWTAESLIKEQPGGLHASSGRIPTVSGVRDFPVVKIGEAVMLEILQNPSTGEKVYDVLRPYIVAPGGRAQVEAVVAQETISLRQIAMRIDGRDMPSLPSWIVGRAVRFEIPGLGAYVVAAYEPPADGVHVFTAAAQANGKTLSWKTGGHRVEIVSETDILSQSATGTLWIYQDSGFKGQGSGPQPRLQAADTVDSLLTDRKDKK